MSRELLLKYKNKVFFGLISSCNKNAMHKATLTSSNYYHQENIANRNSNYKSIEIYKEKLQKEVGKNYNEVHHLKLDHSMTTIEPESLVYMTKKSHCDLHKILDLENEIEILTYFINHPKKDYIQFKGVGMVYRSTVYKSCEIPHIEGIARDEIFQEAIAMRVEEIDKLFPEIYKELEISMLYNENIIKNAKICRG